VIATGGGRTWLLWRDEGPGQVGSELRLIEIPADPLSVDLSSALHLPFAGNSISIRIALAVGDDGLPRVAWVESSLSSVVILRVKNGPTPGNFAYQTVTAPVSSGHSIGSIALAAKNDRVFLTASRSLGTERDLIFTEAIESEESFSFGAVQQVAANNSAG